LLKVQVFWKGATEVRKRLLLLALVMGLAILAMSSVAANPWPDSNALVDVPGLFTVVTSVSAGTTTYTVTLSADPNFSGYAIKAFVPYVGGLTSQPYTQSSTAYSAGTTSLFGSLNGGWEKDKLAGAPSGTSAAFGWQGSGPSTYLTAGNATTFSANLGSATGKEVIYAVHVVTPTGLTFWATSDQNDRVPRVPEPTSLWLLGTGMAGLISWMGIKRRR
jgi:hypothetical protein